MNTISQNYRSFLLLSSLLAASFLLLILVSLSTQAATMATITVTSTADAGAGTLRQAIADATDGDTIDFDKNLNGQTITLTSQLEITETLTIDASALTDTIKISGDNSTGIFDVKASGDVTLTHLTLMNGLNVTGGAIENAGRVVLYGSTVFSNSAGLVGSGGGIVNGGRLELIESTVSSNTAQSGGGIFNIGAMTITMSTIDNNVAQTNGGGIYDSEGATKIYTSTVSSNHATAGGGLWANASKVMISSATFSHNEATTTGGLRVSGGILDLSQTIIANSIGGDCSVTPASIMNTNFSNLVEDGSCQINTSGLFFTGDPLISELLFNETNPLVYKTRTHRPLHPASKVVDSVAAGGYCGPVDQRGFPRPGDGDNDGQPICDIGSVEFVPGLDEGLKQILYLPFITKQ